MICNYETTLDENLGDQVVEKPHTPKVQERLLLRGSSWALDQAVRMVYQVKECQRLVEYVNAISAHMQESKGRSPVARNASVHL